MNESSWYECLEFNSAMKITPDKARANSLIETAKERLDFLKMPVNETNVNFIFEGLYTSVLEMLQALVLSKGFKVTNHVCLGYYLKDILKEDKLYRIFDDCRYKRNSLVYYGKKLNLHIAQDSIEKCKTLINELDSLYGAKKPKMKLGFIGLGRMGKALVLQATEKGHTIVAHNRSPEPIHEVKEAGAIPAYTLEELFHNLKDQEQKIVWLMLTSSVVDEKIQEILPYMSKGDLIIDGGNSWFEDSQRRSKELEHKGIHFIDCGTSGGVEGARHGACMMLGTSNKEMFKLIEPLIRDVCVKDGYAHVGSSGAGHFVKMVHNGIEYGEMAALGEGFQALEKHSHSLSLNLQDISKVYAHGSIVEGKLSTLLQRGLKREDFKDIQGLVPKGETEEEMLKLAKLADMPILEESIAQRVKSRTHPSFSAKIMATLRNEFGGHKVEKK